MIDVHYVPVVLFVLFVPLVHNVPYVLDVPNVHYVPDVLIVLIVPNVLIVPYVLSVIYSLFQKFLFF